MSIRRFFQVGILVILSPLAIGFGGDEHREVSDLALSVAIDYHCSQAGKSQTEKCRKLRMAVDELTADSTEDIKEIMTYGKINEVVDFMHYPRQIFGTGDKPLNDHVLELLNKSSKYAVLFDYLSASSHNERHFQDDLMKRASTAFTWLP